MRVHLRDLVTPTMSLCGQGYAWPSTIALRDRDKIDEVTCAVCLHLLSEQGGDSSVSDLVDPTEIERIVGAKRHRRAHIGRAVSAEQTVYILHSQRCMDSGIDLRDCEFSVALDQGIDLDHWAKSQDMPRWLMVWDGRLRPMNITRQPEPFVEVDRGE